MKTDTHLDSATILQQSAETFRLAFQTSPDVIMLSRLSDSKIIDINEGCTKLTGYTKEDAVGKTALELGLWDNPGDRERLISRLQKDGFVENFEAKFRRKDGQIAIGLMSARVFRAGEEDIILSITRDITERKLAEEALRESEERHRQIVESATDGILVRSGDEIIYANPAAVKLFGARHAGELIGKRYLDLVHPDDRYESAERIRKGLRENWIAPLREHRILALDGRVVHVESAGGPVQYGGETQVFGVFRDITERKQVEEKLRETEKKYRELAESLPQVIFEADLNGRLTYINRAGHQLFGYTPEEMAQGFNILDAFIPEDRKRISLDIMLNIQGNGLGRQDYTAVRKDGTHFPVGVHASRALSGQTATGVRGILIDLTATQQAQEEKRKLETQLQQAQKMEALGALAGGIAHDFNNILSAIIGYIELAMLNVGGGSGLDELRQALKASNRAKDLVKQILAFSRQTDEERMPVKVCTVAKEAAKFLRATIPATVEIKTRIDEKSGAVLVNAVALHQIIMNLCTNAVHAMGEKGGVLEIEVQNAESNHAQKNESFGLDAGPYTRISVKDTGIGMPPEILKRIFDPYFTTKEKGVGTGLGLAVVHGIVKKAGGAIEVESRPGQGSTFHVYLPRVDQPFSYQPEQTGIPMGGSERILFVDDEIMLVDIGQQVLERLGYDVVTRTSPIEALELFKAKPDHFDLVITDQTMPGMTGDVLARELMRLKPDLPVIICPGYSQAIDHEQAKRRGIKAFVMKPILINEIAAAIRSAFDAGGPGGMGTRANRHHRKRDGHDQAGFT